MADVDILLDWSPLSTGLLTNAGLPSAMSFEDLPESDPSIIYNGSGSNFTHTYIADDQGSSPAFPFSVTINGVTSNPVGTKWLFFDLSTVAAQENIWTTFHGGVDENWHNVIKAGFIKIDIGTIANSVNFDLSQMDGPFSVCQLVLNVSQVNKWKSHSQMNGGGSNNGAEFTAETGTFFYQFFRDLTNGMHRIRWYDANDNFALIGESESILGDEVWSYRDTWQNWYNGSQPAQDIQVWFGPTIYQYDSTDFITMDPAGAATMNVTTLNATTLTVG